jgi:hypothetical protein
MFIHCCDTTYFSKDQRCKICQNKATWFCQACEKWKKPKNRSTHLKTQEHSDNSKVNQNSEEKIKIFGYYEKIGITKSFLSTPEKTICD